MRNRILGAIGVLWGGMALLNWFRGDRSHGTGAYAVGYSAGVIFGALLFLVGGYYLLTGGNAKSR
jgi:heme A synthase